MRGKSGSREAGGESACRRKIIFIINSENQGFILTKPELVIVGTVDWQTKGFGEFYFVYVKFEISVTQVVIFTFCFFSNRTINC